MITQIFAAFSEKLNVRINKSEILSTIKVRVNPFNTLRNKTDDSFNWPNSWKGRPKQNKTTKEAQACHSPCNKKNWKNSDQAVFNIGWHDWLNVLQVNIFQMHLLLHQLTHNMAKDCSLNYKLRTWSVHKLFFRFCIVILNNLCTQHVLSL